MDYRAFTENGEIYLTLDNGDSQIEGVKIAITELLGGETPEQSSELMVGGQLFAHTSDWTKLTFRFDDVEVLDDVRNQLFTALGERFEPFEDGAAELDAFATDFPSAATVRGEIE